MNTKLSAGPNDPAENWYYRFTLWNNRIYARCAIWLAHGIAWGARPLPTSARRSCLSIARVLLVMASLIVQPECVRQLTRWRPTLKFLLDALVVAGVPAAWAGYWMGYTFGSSNVGNFASYELLAIFLPALVGGIIGGLIGGLMTLLAASGDVYFEQQDELQKALAHQAAAGTLRLVYYILAALIVLSLFIHPSRGIILLQLTMLLAVIRLIYLIMLAYLRWREVARGEGEREDGGIGVLTLLEDQPQLLRD